MTYSNFVVVLSVVVAMLLLLLLGSFCGRLETSCHTLNPRITVLMQTPGQLSFFRQEVDLSERVKKGPEEQEE